MHSSCIDMKCYGGCNLIGVHSWCFLPIEIVSWVGQVSSKKCKSNRIERPLGTLSTVGELLAKKIFHITCSLPRVEESALHLMFVLASLDRLLYHVRASSWTFRYETCNIRIIPGPVSPPRLRSMQYMIRMSTLLQLVISRETSAYIVGLQAFWTLMIARRL
jgi:hypothetical protein